MKTKRQRYNESLEASGVVRETYATLFEKVYALGPVEMAARRESAADALGELGATFPCRTTRRTADGSCPRTGRRG